MNNFDIIIFKEPIFFRVEITDYVSISEYLRRMKVVDNYGVDELLSTSVLWNSTKQLVNKGIYYVGIVNNRLYNILIKDNELEIDESVKIGDITEEKKLVFKLIDKEYYYSKLKHKKNGSTFYTKFYPFDFKGLALSQDEAFLDMDELISNLDAIEGIENIIDIGLLKNSIFGNGTNKILQRINKEDRNKVSL